MREIKFRYWDGTSGNKCMCYMDLRFVFRYPTSNFPLSFADALRELSSENPYYKNNALMQFTGLKDKNGKEIYEGDIYRNVITGRIEEVKWRNTVYAAGFDIVALPVLLENIEVIGNIYENPELLK